MKKHADKKGKDTWIIIDGLVYDMNIDSPLKGGHSSGEPKFLTDHPGGKKVLIKQGDIQTYLTLLTGADRLIRSPSGGKDASEVFKEFHSKSILEKYGPPLCVGKVKA